MSGIEIRTLAAGDVEAVLTLARGLADWFLPLDQIALAIDLRDHEGLVAVDGQEILGFLTFHFPAPQEAELSWLGVATTAQGRGVGRALLAALEAGLIDRGSRRLEVSTVPADFDARFEATNAFYRRHGFTVAGRDEGYFVHRRPRLRYVKTLGVDDGSTP